MLEKVEQVVRLIRSKGVGVYFITQNPIDIPDKVAGQLGNRVQHALRAFTPRDQAAVKSAAETFRPNPDIDVATRDHRAEGRRGAGFAAPARRLAVAGRAHADQAAALAGRPAHARRNAAIMIQTDAIGAKYDTLLDRDSAEEILKAKGDEAAAAAAAAKAETEAQKAAAEAGAAATRSPPRKPPAARRRRGSGSPASGCARTNASAARAGTRGSPRRAREAAKPIMADKMMQSAGRSIASSVGRQLGNSLLRGIFGGLIRGR